jgi:hypothetical protein
MAKVERVLRRVGRNTLLPRVELQVHPSRADFLLENGFDRIQVLEDRFDVAVDVREDAKLQLDDIRVLDDRGRDVTEKFS